MRYLINRKSIEYASLKVRPSHVLKTDKHDGVFAHVEPGHIVSRESIGFPGFDEIVKQAHMLMSIGNLDFLQGELYSDDHSFQDIQGIVRSGTVSQELKDSIDLHVFNAGSNFKSTRQMFHTLRQAAKQAGCDRIKIIEAKVIKASDVDAELLESIDNGYEGLVLRHLKASDDLLYGFVKLKPYKECDLTFDGVYGDFLEGRGGIRVKGNVDGLPVRVSLGSGFDKATRVRLYKRENVLRGKLVVEVKHNGPNDWPRDDGTYALRDAIFLKTKEDRQVIKQEEGR